MKNKEAYEKGYDMGEKEGIRMGMIILTILLCFIMMFGYFIYSIVLKDDNEFKITKENCWNESNYQDLINSNCLINSSLKGDYVEFKVICPQCYGGDCDYEIKTHQVCELVEVNDLVIYDDCDLVNYENCLLLGIKDTAECLDRCYINWTDTAQNWLYTNISKQDLTIEWLDKNCECSGYKTNNKNCVAGDCLDVFGGVCSEYLCRDYKVEVIK